MSGLKEALKLRCGVVVPGRLALAPLTNTQSLPDGCLGEDERRWLLRRARGGFPWISTCAAYISDQGKAWEGQLGVAEDAHLPGLTRLAGALRAAGAVAVVQLHHGGALASLAPTRLSTVDAPGQRGATPGDLAQVRADFVAAALRCEAAGFAGVEVHGANGYLLTQFLAPLDNPRTDAYGGDLAGRARLLREVLQDIRAAVSPGFAVGVRLSPVDLWSQRGLRLADSVHLGRWLAEDGVDWVHLSLMQATASAPEDPSGPPIATAFRAALPGDVALQVAGAVWTLADAQAARAAGADQVVLGRAAIIHPDWPEVAFDPDFSPSRPPWPLPALVAADVGTGLQRYLLARPGMVLGGALSRG